MKKIIVIGVGQLGSRHLQALSRVGQNLQITVIDPSSASLDTARQRWAEMPVVGHEINFYSDFSTVTGSYDLGIIATSAGPRRQAIEKVFEKANITQLILEKVLFTKKEDYAAIAKLLKQKSVTTWVNHPMRMRMVCKEILSKVSGLKILYFASANMGLVTNAIHYVDHMVQLTGRSEFRVDTSDLEPKLLESKRQGYLELTGTLKVSFSNGSIGVFTSFGEGANPPLIEIHSPHHRFILKDLEKKMYSTSLEEGWKWRESESDFLPQSQMTTQIVTELLSSGRCDLTPFDEAVETHQRFLEPLGQFVRGLEPKRSDDLPFT